MFFCKILIENEYTMLTLLTFLPTSDYFTDHVIIVILQAVFDGGQATEQVEHYVPVGVDLQGLHSTPVNLNAF